MIPGLSLRKRAKGSAWFLYYRTKDGTERRPKLGDANIMDQAAARRAAKAMLLQVANGLDPMLERQRRKEAPTVDALAARYWERHAKDQKAGRDVRRHLDAYILPTLGSKRVIDVVYGDCERLHDRIVETAPIQANRVLATFSVMLSLAERWDMRPVNTNPCCLVKRTKAAPRRRHMTGTEAPKIAAALRAREATAPSSVAFLYLLILSGARRGEIAGARWEWLEGSVLKLPDSKTGARDIHLPPQVMDVLAKLPRTLGTLTGIKDPTKVWQAVREEAGCPDLRLHDLRRSFASAALSAGITLGQVGELLGHRNSQTTKGYAYLMEEAAASAVATVAGKIESMMGATATSSANTTAAWAERVDEVETGQPTSGPLQITESK